jgi:hypothetical protein
VGDVIGGLERANGRAALKAGSGKSESFPRSRPCIGASGETVMMLRVGLCPWSSAGVSSEFEMFRDPLCEASDEVERWSGTLTRLARGPARGELAHGSP